MLFNAIEILVLKNNVDGMKLAQSEKVLEDGIPSVHVYADRKGNVEKILQGDVATADVVLNKIMHLVQRYERDSEGYFVKKDTNTEL